MSLRTRNGILGIRRGDGEVCIKSYMVIPMNSLEYIILYWLYDSTSPRKKITNIYDKALEGGCPFLQCTSIRGKIGVSVTRSMYLIELK